MLTLLLVAALAFCTWFIPEEQTLGGLIRVIFLHGAMVRVGQLAFLAAGILGALYLAKPGRALIGWSWAVEKVALLLWAGYFISSIIAMTQAWGGINWAEPRFQAASQSLVAAVIGFVISYLVARPRVTAGVNMLVAVIVLGLVFSAGLELHPANPVGESNSAELRLIYYLITGLMLLLAAQLTRLLKRLQTR